MTKHPIAPLLKKSVTETQPISLGKTERDLQEEASQLATKDSNIQKTPRCTTPPLPERT